MMAPTATVKHIILSTLLEGRWIETAYALDDYRWKEALQVLRELNTTVKMTYKP
jgi:hypothetical protein